MKITLTLKDGTSTTIEDPAAAQTLLDQQVTAAEDRGAQAERARLAELVGLTPASLTESATLARLTAEASDGRSYREDLLDRLERVTLTVEGNTETGQKAAERAKKVFKVADISDIRDEVERLEAKRDQLVPNGQRSATNAEEEPEEPSKAHVRDFDSV